MYLLRVIFVSMMKEMKVEDKLHENDNLYSQNAQQLSHCAALFRPGCWMFVGPKSENTRNAAKHRTDIRINKLYGFFTNRQNPVTQLFPAPLTSSRAASKKGVHRVHQHNMQADRVGKYFLHSLRTWMTCNADTCCSNKEKNKLPPSTARNGLREKPRAQ